MTGVFVNWWGGQVGAPMRYATAIHSVPPTLEEDGAAGHAGICSATRTRPISCGLDGTQPTCSDGWDTRIYKTTVRYLTLTCPRKTWVRCSIVTKRSARNEHQCGLEPCNSGHASR